MLKNSVLRPSVDTQKWFKAAKIRAVKTMAQVAIAGIGASTVMGQVDWIYVVSTSVLSGLVSMLTSILGIPEVESEDN